MKKRGTRAPAQQFIKNILPSQKRSQAFLITAVIFIAIASAIITIHNYSKKTEFSTFPYIAEEIQIESEKVMNYDFINNDNKIENFIKKTSDYVKKDGINIYFITEESGSLRCSKCDALDTSTNPINATIKENSYYFTKYPKGKHFYFIMIKEKGGEKYVYTNA
ncbi:MAG TPA: hypothetical protein VJA20_00140 [Candidatus Nanoarchaeia archaeon]|nr:hypothetical protein [Candidatus Nanoarchaeia archaeon]